MKDFLIAIKDVIKHNQKFILFFISLCFIIGYSIQLHRANELQTKLEQLKVDTLNKLIQCSNVYTELKKCEKRCDL